MLYYNYGDCCEKLSDLVDAKDAFLSAAKAYENIFEEDADELIETYLRAFDISLNLNGISEAEAIYNTISDMLKFFAKCSADIFYYNRLIKSNCSSDTYYRFRLCESTLLLKKGQYEKVVEITDTCLEKANNKPMKKSVLLKFLETKYWALLDMGNTEACLKILNQIEKLTLSFPGIPQWLPSRMRAEIMDEIGNTEEAEQNFQKAWELYSIHSSNDTFAGICILTNWAYACIHAYKYTKAQELAEKCIFQIEKIETDSYNYAYLPVFHNLGLIYLRLLDSSKAEKYLYLALNLSRKYSSGTSISNEIAIIIDLGLLYLNQDQYQISRDYAQTALRLLDNLSENIQKTSAYENKRREIYRIMAKCDETTDERLHWIDMAIANDPENSLELYRDYAIKGDLLQEIDLNNARNFLFKSYELLCLPEYEKSELVPKIMMNCLSVLDFESDDDITKAKEILSKLQKIATNRQFTDSAFQIYIYREMCMYYALLDMNAEMFYSAVNAILLYDQIIHDFVQSGTFSGFRIIKRTLQIPYYILMLAVCGIDKNDQQHASILTLLNNYKMGDYYLLRSINQNPKLDYTAEKRKVELELNHINYQSFAKQHIKNLEQGEDLLLKKYDLYYRFDQSDLNEDKAEFDISDNYIDFWYLDYYFPENQGFTTDCFAFVVVWPVCDSKKKRIIKLKKTAKEICSLIQCFHNVIHYDKPANKEINDLRTCLFTPVIKAIPEISSGHKLVICPDGVISSVPFDLIVGDNYRILYTPFVNMLTSKEYPGGNTMIVGGNPVITKDNPFSLSELNSVDECNSITEILKSKGFSVIELLSNGQSTLPFCKKELVHTLQTNNCELIHLSTHGFYKDNDTSPYQRWGLVLNDIIDNGHYDINKSILWAEDVVKTDMAGVKLAVLSSCSSGNGEFYSGDWMIGFQRALFVAGVEGVVASLWDVNEKASEILMKHFYMNLVEGMEIDVALQKAKKDLRHYGHGIYNAPCYWAAWIYTGKVGSLFLSLEKQ